MDRYPGVRHLAALAALLGALGQGGWPQWDVVLRDVAYLVFARPCAAKGTP